VQCEGQMLAFSLLLGLQDYVTLTVMYNLKLNKMYKTRRLAISKLFIMRRKIYLLLILTSIFCAKEILAQERIDTTYYDKDWKGPVNKHFADFYRIAIYPENSSYKKQFRDYFITGELQATGGYISLDKFDDDKSVFDGECISYYKNGKMQFKRTYSSGSLNGDYYEYTEDGLVIRKGTYKNNELDGLYTEFIEDGNYIQAEYMCGRPKYDYYIMSNPNGQVLKISYSDNNPIWESPTVNERKTEYKDGTPWQFYTKNGLMVALTSTPTKDYGKWHKADIVISNNSMVPIEFNPEDIVALSIDKYDKESNLIVWSCEDYMRKVRRAQTWEAVAVGLSEGLANMNAGYSTSTTYQSGQVNSYGSNSAYGTYYGSSSYSGVSYTTNYDAAAAYQARALSANRMADFDNAQWNDRQVRQEGYLKKNTIYPGETISGYVHIKRIPWSSVCITVKINDADYIFDWVYDK